MVATGDKLIYQNIYYKIRIMMRFEVKHASCFQSHKSDKSYFHSLEKDNLILIRNIVFLKATKPLKLTKNY